MVVAVIITLITFLGLLWWDTRRWKNNKPVRHGVGLVTVLVILGVVSWSIKHPWPLLFYVAFWNPVISLVNGQKWWYLGEEAWTDRTLKWIFGDEAGKLTAPLALFVFLMSFVIW